MMYRQVCKLIVLRACFTGTVLIPLIFSEHAQAQFKTLSNNGYVTIVKYTGSGGAVEIPATINGLPVTSIGDKLLPNNAFRDCDSVTSISIPSTVTSIGANGFSDCKNLASITVSKQNPVYSSLDGVLFTRDQTMIVQFPRAKGDKYTIPRGVTRIGVSAFFKCTKLTNVTIPPSVTSIGPYAFSGCTNLTNVQVPNRVRLIALYAFYGCQSLTTITIPKSVVSIGQGAFQTCGGLKRAVFEGNAPSMAPDVFKDVADVFVISYSRGASGFTLPKWTDSSEDVYPTSAQ